MNKLFGILYTCTIILALTLLVSGCSSVPTPTLVPTIAPTLPPTATPIPSATPTNPPTATPLPTNTPTLPPTATPLPTNTPTLSPTATSTKAATSTVVPTIASSLSPTATVSTAAQTTGISKDTCLGCHGPFDKLVFATANYLWPNGTKQSPHRYVPHDSKNVPECSSCHKPHPLPPTASDIAAMAKPNPQSCFTCHHTGTLECGTCHAIPDAF